jgi:hypothetical protein
MGKRARVGATAIAVLHGMPITQAFMVIVSLSDGSPSSGQQSWSAPAVAAAFIGQRGAATAFITPLAASAKASRTLRMVRRMLQG